jgi:uncharacterized protein YjbI with pentapeptide repeats
MSMSRRFLTWWLLLPGVTAVLIQHTAGWTRTGQAMATAARVVGELAWLVVWAVWPLLLVGLLIAWLRAGRPVPTLTRPRLLLFVGLAGAGVLGVLAVVIVVAPPLFVPTDPDLDLQELYQERNAVRTSLLQAVAGLVLLLGAYFTYRQVQNSTRALQHTQEQIEIARAGQVTERFTRAIDQLGQHGSDKLDIRLGGIYALERIARDSADDRAAVADVFCAYVRQHCPRPSFPSGQHVTDASLGEIPPLRTRALDVQAVLTALVRGVFAGQSLQLDLRDADLRNADLEKAQLHETRLFGANLSGVDLREANLRKADLREANLGEANLGEADLREAHLFGADLREADLRSVDLFEADLREADLREADLREADLSGANLNEADLSGAILREVDLGGVVLREASLHKADLREVNLREADLGGANLFRANLQAGNLGKADLREANLFEVNLRGANLYGSDLREVNLRGANLIGADLGEADLREADLRTAVADSVTKWPDAFDWNAAGVRMVSDEPATDEAMNPTAAWHIESVIQRAIY